MLNFSSRFIKASLQGLCFKAAAADASCKSWKVLKCPNEKKKKATAMAEWLFVGDVLHEASFLFFSDSSANLSHHSIAKPSFLLLSHCDKGSLNTGPLVTAPLHGDKTWTQLPPSKPLIRETGIIGASWDYYAFISSWFRQHAGITCRGKRWSD